MTLDEGFSYLESFTNLEKKPDPTLRAYRLDRMERILDVFGKPHKSFKSFHVAGSKGKGSTSFYLAGGLEALGYKTGLYTSPHLLSYTERITLAGKPFPDELYLKNITQIKNWVESGGQKLLERDYLQGPTTFELLTLLAFLIFREAGVQWVVAEVGLGGRLDATNVLIPQATVLTPIELEHTEILGNTLEAIAGEKGGIIKPGIPVFCAPQPRQVYEVFSVLAREKTSPLTYLPDVLGHFWVDVGPKSTRITWAYKGQEIQKAELVMLGEVMAWNNILAHRVLWEILAPKDEDQEKLLRGLEKVKIPGRMQALPLKPAVVVDGAHTRRSCEELVKTLEKTLPGPRTLIFGAVEGKDWEGMAEVLSSHFTHIIITTPGSFKKSDPAALAKIFNRHKAPVLFQPDLDHAWKTAQDLGHPTVVCGSFYLVADFIRLTGV